MNVVRVLRAVLAGSVVTCCAALAHVLAGGHLDGAVLVAVATGSSLVALAVGGRRLETSVLLGLLLLGQAATHVTAAPPAQDSGAAMAVTHLLATVLSLAVLRRGEDVLWALAEHLGLRVAVLEAVPVALPGPGRTATRAPAPPRGLQLAHAVQGRAPPVRS